MLSRTVEFVQPDTEVCGFVDVRLSEMRLLGGIDEVGEVTERYAVSSDQRELGEAPEFLRRGVTVEAEDGELLDEAERTRTVRGRRGSLAVRGVLMIVTLGSRDAVESARLRTIETEGTEAFLGLPGVAKETVAGD